jgi:3-oxoacyl-[acyl-carrier protein] reductase
MPSVLLLGARNLGGAILDHLLGAGWSGAAVAHSDETLERVRSRGALALQADAADPAQLRDAIARAREELGGLDLLVNAVSASRPPAGSRSGFGGGPLAEATLEGWRGWGGAVAEQGFVFLSEGARALRAQGRGGTLIQATGGSARRAMPGRGLWAAGAFGVRAITTAAAQELREHGIHVSLLIVDAGIEPFEGAGGDPATADPREIATAVAFLAEQGARAATHELQVTPLAERWVP